MTAYTTKSFLAASALTLAVFAVPAGAQVVRDGTSGGVQGTDVSASTCGEGTTTGTSITVSGCADATATNGTASTTSRA